MRAFLLIGAAVAAYGSISVNFNACNGGTDAPAADACSASLKGKTIIMHVDADFPPFNDVNSTSQEVEGFAVDLFAAMCATAAFQEAGITCRTVRDLWTHAWSQHDTPGFGMMSQWYDMAFGYVTTPRSQSFDFGHMLTYAPLTSVLKMVDEPVNADGEGEVIVLNCGWGYNSVVSKLYPKATVLIDHDRNEGCAVGAHAQIDRLHKGTATIALIPEGELPNLSDLPATYSVYKINMTEAFPDVIQNGLGFFFNKRDNCLRTAANSAVEALRDSGEYATLCAAYDITCY
ncbi:hypothetical protein DIPPA_14469 [Diplonema papillatum]|nr:hypothetical protein DIPPA_14469 [Diplonema papillatum]